MLQVEDLGKRFGDRWVFRHLSFSLQKGDALLVLGSNGSGKSTLLKLIASLLPATEGRIQLPEGDPRLVVGVSSLDMALYAQLTVVEHLELASHLRGCESRSDELLSLVGLEASATDSVGHLSTGMKARLKIALAIQPRPSVLLLDEPGAGFDEHGRALLDVICSEQRQRGALIVATNDPAERRLGNFELKLAS